MTVSSDVLLCDHRDDGIAVLTLNRPDARNALSAQLRDDLSRCLRQLATDDAVRVVLITGTGDMFCAGFDLKELSAGDPSEIFAAARIYHHDVYTFAKPLIAAINGPALAGGMDLAAMCDIRVAAGTAEFGQPQVRLGIPAAYDLIRTVMFEPAARRLCLTGERIGSEAAAKYGFVSEVFQNEALVPEAIQLAQIIAGDASSASGAMKSRFVAAQPGLFEA